MKKEINTTITSEKEIIKQPKDWWGNSDNAEWWIDQVARAERGLPEYSTTIQSQEIVLNEIGDKFKKVLEVGAGNGRLIGNLSKWNPKVKCSSIDINKKMSGFVSAKYPRVKTYVGEITKLPFKDNEFDLVYTYQVLQHIAPDEIEQAVRELIRVSKSQVWCWEGIGRLDYEHGAMTHKAHNGSWVWHIDKIVNCCKVSIPKNKVVSLDRQRLYKIKKDEL